MTICIDAAQMQAALEKMASNAAPTQTPTELADKFQSLMQTSKLEPPAQALQNKSEVASEMLKQQDAQLERVSSDMDAIQAAAPDMSLQELSASATRLMMEMSSAQINLQAKMGVVESSKSSVETLMRNQ